MSISAICWVLVALFFCASGGWILWGLVAGALTRKPRQFPLTDKAVHGRHVMEDQHADR